jgi:hypothetical protein
LRTCEFGYHGYHHHWRIENAGESAVDKHIGQGSGALVSVLWKSIVLAFLATFSDETADVDERVTTAVTLRLSSWLVVLGT